MAEPGWTLRCAHCKAEGRDTRFARDEQVTLLLEHTRDEHPDQLRPDGLPLIRMVLTPVCTRCESAMEIFAVMDQGQGMEEHHFVCPQDKRSYEVMIRREPDAGIYT